MSTGATFDNAINEAVADADLSVLACGEMRSRSSACTYRPATKRRVYLGRARAGLLWVCVCRRAMATFFALRSSQCGSKYSCAFVLIADLDIRFRRLRAVSRPRTTLPVTVPGFVPDGLVTAAHRRVALSAFQVGVQSVRFAQHRGGRFAPGGQFQARRAA